jgi:hypothetical protein
MFNFEYIKQKNETFYIVNNESFPFNRASH